MKRCPTCHATKRTEETAKKCPGLWTSGPLFKPGNPIPAGVSPRGWACYRFHWPSAQVLRSHYIDKALDQELSFAAENLGISKGDLIQAFVRMGLNGLPARERFAGNEFERPEERVQDDPKEQQ